MAAMRIRIGDNAGERRLRTRCFSPCGGGVAREAGPQPPALA